MLTILITDDENEEREGIAFLIEELGLELTPAFAANGKQALEYLSAHDVDILFTDIRMPIMDGLELVKQVRARQMDLKIIIYSGYSEFSYAKQAINLGVSDYILKPVNIEEFQQTLSRTIADITQERQRKELISANKLFAKKHLLYNAINYPGFFSSHCEEMKLYLSAPYQKLFLLEFDKDFFDTAALDFEKEISNLLPVSFDYLNLNMKQSILLFFEKEESMDFSYYELAMKIRNWITDTFADCCYIAVSSNLENNEQLADVFTELESLIEYRFFVPDTFIFEKERLLSNYMTTEYTDTRLLENIEKDLKSRNFLELHLHLDLLFQKYQNNVEFSQLYVKFVFSTLYKNIITEFNDLSELDLNRSIDKLYRSTNLQEMKSLILEMISSLEEHNSVEENTRHDIELVKDYIESHYAEDLDLVSLAEKVYLSPTYLSARFKQATGSGINKYIKMIRMKKAEELLTHTNIKVVDICSQVGFRNLSYFCQNFREYAGETPEKYRKHHFSLQSK